MKDWKKPDGPVFGWTTCLNYEIGPEPLGFEHFRRLLDEMDGNGMRMVIVMMASEGPFDPLHHGLAWPARGPLASMVDPTAVNADPRTEFFGRFIDAAHAKGIEVFIEIKFLGLDGVEEAYPGIEFTVDGEGRRNVKVPDGADVETRRRTVSQPICCDGEQAMRFFLDKMRDVLGRYPALDGVVLEHPSYPRGCCFCDATRRRLLADIGRTPESAAPEELVRWKAMRIRDILTEVRHEARRLIPGLQLGFYTGFSPADGDIRGFQEGRGHAPEAVREAGWDFVMPYCEGRHREREAAELERVIGYLEPMPVLVHAVIRRESPRGYPLPPKDPAYVGGIVASCAALARREPRFRGMCFFNEVKVPPDNRQAAYDGIAASFRPNRG